MVQGIGPKDPSNFSPESSGFQNLHDLCQLIGQISHECALHQDIEKINTLFETALKRIPQLASQLNSTKQGGLKDLETLLTNNRGHLKELVHDSAVLPIFQDELNKILQDLEKT